MRGLFVTGTDTGVGKTLITAGLTALYRKNNIDCVALKPVETGCAIKDGELFPEDGNFLWRASQNALNMDDVAPFRFSLPAAPYRAAALQNSRLRIMDVLEHVRAVQESHDLVIVEGAGGLFVPIEEKGTFIDLLEKLGFPVVLVARARLGTINHTLLSVESLEKRNIKIFSVILSKGEIKEGPEEKYTAEDLKRMTDNKRILEFPYLSEDQRSDPLQIAEIMSKLWSPDIFLGSGVL